MTGRRNRNENWHHSFREGKAKIHVDEDRIERHNEEDLHTDPKSKQRKSSISKSVSIRS